MSYRNLMFGNWLATTIAIHEMTLTKLKLKRSRKPVNYSALDSVGEILHRRGYDEDRYKQEFVISKMGIVHEDETTDH